MYIAGLYIRLSKEDDDKSYESESIINQKSLLMQYTNENNIKVYDIYIDDGYSGTNFERPSFKRLVEDIENKKINMVITKDMSRLGRDYIKTGELIEKYFPEHNIRYISITDNIDTFLNSSDNDIAPFKAIMNDFYAKDISKKIRSSLKAKMKEGKYVGPRTPYGYSKDKKDKNHLVVNQEQAKIVKEIFELANEGLTCYNIARKLSNEKIRTPASYYDFKYRNAEVVKYTNWNAKTIKDILRNQVYVGDLVQNRRNKLNYKIKKIVKVDPSNFIIIKNTHESIIDRDLFLEVQKKLPKCACRNEKKEHHLLDGLMYCADCGHRISVTPRRKKDNRCYTVCNYHRTYRREKLCSGHCNNYDDFEITIINLLKNECLKYVDKDKLKANVSKKIENDGITNYNLEIEKLKDEIKKINDNLDNIYIDKLNNVISLEQFERVNKRMQIELNAKKDKISFYNELLNNKHEENDKSKVIDKCIENLLDSDVPSRELIMSLIERIEISENKEINLILTFNNVRHT